MHRWQIEPLSLEGLENTVKAKIVLSMSVFSFALTPVNVSNAFVPGISSRTRPASKSVFGILA
jgi:hypothetical protein